MSKYVLPDYCYCPAEGGIRPLLTLIIFVEEALGHRKDFDVISLVIKHWNILSRVLLAFLSFFLFLFILCSSDDKLGQ